MGADMSMPEVPGMPSSPIKAEHTDQIKEIASRVVSTFATEFSAAYPLALLAKIKEDADEAQADAEDEHQLVHADDAAWVKKEGTIQKEGGSHTAFKERHLVARNKRDNYKLEYYTKENGTKKGEINCKGYYAREFDNSDKEQKCTEDFPFGVKLEPNWWSRGLRRSWYIRCKTKEDQDEWLEVLQYACRYAKAPLPDDKALAEAFVSSFWATRRAEGIWSTYGCDGTPAENISYFIYTLIDDAFLRDLLADTPDMMKEKCRGLVLTTINSIVKPAWMGAEKTIQGISEKVQEQIGAGIEPIIKVEADMIKKIGDLAEGTAGKLISVAVDKFCPSVLEKTCKPIADGCAHACRGWTKFVREQNADDPTAFDSERTKVRIERHGWYNGNRQPMGATYEACRDIRDNLSNESLFTEGSGYKYYEVYWDARDLFNQYWNDATSTLYSKIAAAKNDGKTPDVDKLIDETAAMMIHDSELLLTDIFMKIFTELITENEGWQATQESITGAVEPLQASIEALAPLDIFINLPDFAQKVLDQLLESTLTPILVTGTGGKLSVEDLKKELNV